MIQMTANRSFMHEGAIVRRRGSLAARDERHALALERSGKAVRGVDSSAVSPTPAARQTWWPDWKGQIVAIVASGPSAGTLDLAALEGHAKVIAVNRSHELVPFADLLYAADHEFWRANLAARDFPGLKLSQDPSAVRQFGLHPVRVRGPRHQILTDQAGVVGNGGNSGFHAVNLAVQFGARRIVLIGFDLTLAGGVHWHADHAHKNPDAPALARWASILDSQAGRLSALGVEVINTSPISALTAYPVALLDDALNPDFVPPPVPALDRRPLVISGMHGLGDNIHQRGIVRELIATREVWLETPWPCVYHDLVGPRLHLVGKGSRLRTQAKNARREAALFSRRSPPRQAETLAISYPPQLVRQAGSVMRGMLLATGMAGSDFRLPIPDAWRAKAFAWLDQWRPEKPIMIYRPLNERSEWSGCANRNPDHAHYADLFEAIRDQFFVVSVADFEAGKEWMVGRPVAADVELHRGELDFETLAALTSMAGLVYTSPGFSAVLGQAVGTPVTVVFGGYENGASFSAGAAFAPYLPIEPVEPCQCFSHDHKCKKAIAMPAARKALKAFVEANPVRLPPERPVLGGLSEVRPNTRVAPAKADLSGLPTAFMNPGELETLVALVDGVKAKVVVEIGVNGGRTAKALLRNVASIERYYGVDVPPSYEFGLRLQAKECPPKPGELALDDPRFRLLLARRGTFDLSPADFPQADVVFIDGDHGEAGVRNDHALALAIVRPGGLIIHHDDHDLGNVDVRQVLDALHDEAAPIHHVTGTWLAFMQVPEATP